MAKWRRKQVGDIDAISVNDENYKFQLQTRSAGSLLIVFIIRAVLIWRRTNAPEETLRSLPKVDFRTFPFLYTVDDGKFLRHDQDVVKQ